MYSFIKHFLPPLFLMLSIHLFAQNTVPDEVELRVLQDLYTSLNGENWTNNTGWPTLSEWQNNTYNADFSQWRGLTVRNGDIISISLTSNNLNGPLPSSISALSGLKYLNLSNNQLTGSLSHDISNLSQLMFLLLGDNQLSGSLPGELGNLSQLRELRLYNNNLWGQLPASLGQLGKLKKLLLNGNNLTGPIPDTFGNLSALEVLSLNHNQLSGSVPNTLVAVSPLKSVLLNHNRLSGFPDFSAHTSSNLLSINISDNQLPYADIIQNMEDSSFPFATFVYTNQSTYGENDQEGALLENQTIDIATNDFSGNTYTWEKKGKGRTWSDVTSLNEHPTDERYVLNNATISDAGIYRYTITNSIIGETKTSDEIHISIQTRKQDFLDRWAFQYHYDGRGRMTKKKVPGSGWVYMVYDHRDRLVLTQDSIQRKGWQWLFTKYDELNRPIMTGIYQMGSSISQEDIQSYLDTFYDNPSFPNRHVYETYVGDQADNLMGYTNHSFPDDPSRITALSVTYYDNYDFLGLSAFGSSYDYDSLQLSCKTTNDTYCFPAEPFKKVKGYVTGAQTRILGSDNWLSTASYYDDRYRNIQTLGENHKGGVDITSNLYDFVGNVIQAKTMHDNMFESHTILQDFCL